MPLNRNTKHIVQCTSQWRLDVSRDYIYYLEEIMEEDGMINF